MAVALRGPEFSTMDVTRHDWKLARDLGLPISVHVGSGPFGVPYRAIEHLSEAHLLGPDTQYVHTTTLTDEAMQLIAESGGTAAVTPAVERQTFSAAKITPFSRFASCRRPLHAFCPICGESGE